MKRTFILTSPAFEGEVELVYVDGVIVSVIMEKATLRTEMTMAILKHVGIKIEDVKLVCGDSTTAKLVEIVKEVTFDEFWKRYNNKISNKKRTMNKWNSMAKGEQKKAFEFVNKYYAMLPPGQVAKYAETYLNSEIWNN